MPAIVDESAPAEDAVGVPVASISEAIMLDAGLRLARRYHNTCTMNPNGLSWTGIG